MKNIILYISSITGIGWLTKKIGRRRKEKIKQDKFMTALTDEVLKSMNEKELEKYGFIYKKK